MSGSLTEEERESMAAALVATASELRNKERGGFISGVTLVVTFTTGEPPYHRGRVSSDAVSWYAHTAEVFDAGTSLLHSDDPRVEGT